MSNTTPDADRWLASIREIIRQEVAARLPYSGVFDYQVVFSNGSTVDALPVDTSRGLPPVQGIPIRTGIAGASCEPTPGSHLAIGFLDQNPTKPYVLGVFDSTGALSVTLNTSTGTAEHLTTIEGVCAMLVQLGTATLGGGGGWTEVQIGAAISAAAAAGILPTTLAAIKGALTAKAPNLTGLQPSVGCPNLLGG
jgi:hypothetical protein